MKPKKPTIKRAKSISTKQSFERGTEYFEQDCVTSAHIRRSSIVANVIGSSIYEVTVPLGSSKSWPYCTCPYNFEGSCKHVVAVFLYASKNFKGMLEEEGENAAVVEEMFSSASDREIREFLQAKVESDSGLKWEFANYFSKSHAVPRMNCREEINRLYTEASRPYEDIEYETDIDFSHVVNIAKLHEKQENFADAEGIYRDLSEAIVKNARHTGDSQGYYGECLDDAVKSMTLCINGQKLDSARMRNRISYIFREYLGDTSGCAANLYYNALLKICKSRDDWKYLKQILAPHIPGNTPSKDDFSQYKISQMVSMMKRAKNRIAKKRNGAAGR